jgi:hypothetical protein
MSPLLVSKELGQLNDRCFPPESCWLTDEVTGLVLGSTNTSFLTERQRVPLLSILVEAQPVEYGLTRLSSQALFKLQTSRDATRYRALSCGRSSPNLPPRYYSSEQQYM